MLAMVVAYGVKVVMTNHVYVVGDKFYLQSTGGPIGLELTGVLARIVMMSWDRRYLQKVALRGIRLRAYSRYVDDSNQIAQIKEGSTEEETRKELLEIANSIEEGIEVKWILVKTIVMKNYQS